MPRRRLEVSFPVLWALLVVSAAELRGAWKLGASEAAGHHARSGAWVRPERCTCVVCFQIIMLWAPTPAGRDGEYLCDQSTQHRARDT